MRIKKTIADISTSKVKSFYEQRASSYSGENVYNVVALQDNNPELADLRTKAEAEKILPKLKITAESCVLDLACGVGRWLDILPEVKKYRGIDFAEGLIDIARSRTSRPEAKFFTGSVLDADKILADEAGSFDRILMVAFFLYMNDADILSLLRKIPALTTKGGGGNLHKGFGWNRRTSYAERFSFRGT